MNKIIKIIIIIFVLFIATSFLFVTIMMWNATICMVRENYSSYDNAVNTLTNLEASSDSEWESGKIEQDHRGFYTLTACIYKNR